MTFFYLKILQEKGANCNFTTGKSNDFYLFIRKSNDSQHFYEKRKQIREKQQFFFFPGKITIF